MVSISGELNVMPLFLCSTQCMPLCMHPWFLTVFFCPVLRNSSLKRKFETSPRTSCSLYIHALHMHMHMYANTYESSSDFCLDWIQCSHLITHISFGHASAIGFELLLLLEEKDIMHWWRWCYKKIAAFKNRSVFSCVMFSIRFFWRCAHFFAACKKNVWVKMKLRIFRTKNM